MKKLKNTSTKPHQMVSTHHVYWCLLSSSKILPSQNSTSTCKVILGKIKTKESTSDSSRKPCQCQACVTSRVRSSHLLLQLDTQLFLVRPRDAPHGKPQLCGRPSDSGSSTVPVLLSPSAEGLVGHSRDGRVTKSLTQQNSAPGV